MRSSFYFCYDPRLIKLLKNYLSRTGPGKIFSSPSLAKMKYWRWMKGMSKEDKFTKPAAGIKPTN